MTSFKQVFKVSFDNGNDFIPYLGWTADECDQTRYSYVGFEEVADQQSAECEQANVEAVL